MPTENLFADLVAHQVDVASMQNPIPSGRYRLFSLDSNDIAKDVAKMDFAIVELSKIESGTATG